MEFWRRYWAIIRSFKQEIVRAFVLIALTSVLGLLVPYGHKLVFDLVNYWAMTDKGATPKALEFLVGFMPQEHTMLWLAGTVLAFLFLAELISGCVGLVQDRWWVKIVQAMDMNVPVKTMHHLLSLSTGHHVRERTSKQITKINRGVVAAGKITNNLFRWFVPQLFMIVLYAAVIFLLSPLTGVVVLVLGIVSAVWAWVDHRKMQPHQKKIEELQQNATTISYEVLANIATVQAFGCETHEYTRIKEALGDTRALEWKQSKRMLGGGWMRYMLGNITAILVAIICLWGISAKTLTLGSMLMLMQMGSRFIYNSRSLTQIWIEMTRSREAINYLAEILEQMPEVVSAPNARSITNLEGHIAFKHVTFAYTDESDALCDVSFEAQAGEMIALVGPSGSGKSTIASLLLRAYDPNSGSVAVDGVDVRTLNLDDYRSYLGIVHQQVELFSVSIRDNIAYGRLGASHEEIEQAARLAGAHTFILKKPEGYDTIVGERGLDLSGGERQRIGIARAILRNPRILIFDEATSNLDVLSEQKIQQALETLRHGRTTIVIAHRFSTIKRADRIVVIDQGCVVAQGTREELREGSVLFAELERLQATEAIIA